MAQKDTAFGLVNLLDDAIDALDEVLEKHRKRLHSEDVADIERVVELLEDIANEHDPESLDIEGPEESEVLIPEVINAEVVK